MILLFTILSVQNYAVQDIEGLSSRVVIISNIRLKIFIHYDIKFILS